MPAVLGMVHPVLADSEAGTVAILVLFGLCY